MYEFDMGNGFIPFLQSYFPSKEAPIRELIEDLAFIKNTEKWGMAFCLGHFQIPKENFELIKSKMLLELEYLQRFGNGIK